MNNVQLLQDQLGYNFKDVSLLKCALTHRSYGKPNYERLEFVGDGILDYVIAINLYNLYPDLTEGDLSRVRASLVNQDSLYRIGDALSLGEYILLGDGEKKSGGKYRPSIIADVLEALFAAISLDSDLETARSVVERLFANRLKNINTYDVKDCKSVLQEYLQGNHFDLPSYQVVGYSGPDHNSTFEVECGVRQLNQTVRGFGRSKKEASQQAASKMLEVLRVDLNSSGSSS